MLDLDEVKKNVSILDIARIIGLTPVKIGSFYTLKEHDSVRINPSKNVFIQNSSGRGGTVIDFIMTFNNYNLKEAVRFLNNYYYGENLPKNNIEYSNIRHSGKTTFNESKDITQNIVLPQKDNNMRNVFAYLTQTRFIDKDIVKDMVDKKMLYQDVNKNCVFVARDNDNIVRFVNKRGTNTFKRFMQDVSGCDYEYSFFIDNGSKKLIVGESVIDILSIQTLLKKHNEDYNAYNYLALSGVGKFEKSIKYHINNNSYDQIIICFDNDQAGIKTAGEVGNMLKDYNIVSFYIPPALGKDYNEFLQIVSKEKAMTNVYDKLIDKMYKEYTDFINEVKSYDNEKIIEKAYEITFKKEVLFQLVENIGTDISEKEAEVLLLEANPLECCYERWLKTEDSLAEELKYCIKDEADRLMARTSHLEKKNDEIDI